MAARKGGKLGEYERKRDFEKTAEPAAKRRRAKKGAPRFVVQEHSARRLHWDLRLEHEGVAVSWAVPNGIPDDPHENRLAVHVEDHPVEYMTFSGEIPAGEYGGGDVAIWDHGTYEVHKWTEGKIVFSFAGERLRGKYALFRTRSEKDWMIHRMDPPSEERDPFPEQVEPMFARVAKQRPRSGEWGVEVRWQGMRAIAFCPTGRLDLIGADGANLSRDFTQVRRLSRHLGGRDAIFDGVLVEERYVIFDLLYLGRADLRPETYASRRQQLEELGLEGEAWQVPSYSTGDPRQLLEAGAERGLSGLVLKRLDSPYRGGESDDWRQLLAR